MRILLDQGTPVPLRKHLSAHSVVTAFDLGWATLKNGELLQQVEAANYELLITTDQNLRYRQNLAIPAILRDAVEHSSTTYPSFIKDGNRRDTWLDHARLFGRQGKPCLVCGTHIERIRVAGRGTNYCPHCQRCFAREDVS